MAISRDNQREENQLITGPVKVRMVAVSPETKEEAAEYGVFLTNEPNYITERDGEVIRRIEFYLQADFVEVNGKVSQTSLVPKDAREFSQVYRLSIFLSDAMSVSAGTGKTPEGTVQMIDKHGKTAFVVEGAEQYTWFDYDSARPAYKQEATLYEFLVAACHQNTSKDADSVLLETDPMDLIEGNLDELRQIVEEFADSDFYVLLGVNENGYQEVYKTAASTIRGIKTVIKKANDKLYPWKADFSEVLNYYNPSLESASATSKKPELDIDFV